MKRGRAFFLSAGIWEFLRFIAVFLSSAAQPSATRNAHLNLLWLAGPGVVLAALFFSSAYYPDRIRAYLPILRIGAATAVVVDAAVVLSGSYNWSLPSDVASVSAASGVLFLLAFGVLVLDLIVGSLLLSYRHRTTPPPPLSDTQSTNSDMDDDQLPTYEPTNDDRLH